LLASRGTSGNLTPCAAQELSTARKARQEKGEAMAMSRVQQIITRLVPRSWAAAMEEESRNWMVRCPSCGFEQSIWDLGGIRWKARGNKRIWFRCPNCGTWGWRTLERR
jgi:predicted RNA-binding Zn-ribbon protein involved in translation (DUF1610 family)